MFDNKLRVLVVDDNLEMAKTLADGLMDHGYTAVAVGSGEAAAERLHAEAFDAMVTDLRMPKVNGLDLLALSRRLAPERPVIMMTAYSALDTAVESIRQGAYHYLTKPFKVEELALFLRRALDELQLRSEAAALKKALRDRFSVERLLGESTAMRNVREIVARVAGVPVPVLILGETGTGKSLAAQAIHAESNRAAGRLVVVNCAALPEALLETELFGYVKGAFTGATSDHHGLFHEASGGTLFLDEIGEMTPGLQAKLLHAIEKSTVRPVGATKETEVDVRLIVATHRNLREAVRNGTFREDLLYRLDVLSITMPALRDRPEDLPELIAYFFKQAKAKFPTALPQRFSRDAMGCLLTYGWPGNVRELAHVLEKVVLLGRSEVVTLEDLPENLRLPGITAAHEFEGEIVPIRDLQRRYAVWAMSRLGGHKGRVAEKLGIDAKTLWKWLGEAGAPE